MSIQPQDSVCRDTGAVPLLRDQTLHREDAFGNGI